MAWMIVYEVLDWNDEFAYIALFSYYGVNKEKSGRMQWIEIKLRMILVSCIFQRIQHHSWSKTKEKTEVDKYKSHSKEYQSKKLSADRCSRVVISARHSYPPCQEKERHLSWVEFGSLI